MPAAGGVPEPVFRPAFALPAWLAAGGFGVAVTVIVLAVHPRDATETLTGALAAATLVAVLMAVLLHLARCRVIASVPALIVVQPLRRHVVPWGQVADVAVEGNGGLRIVLADRSAIAVYAFGGSVIGAFTGGIRARKARDGIKAVMARAADDAPVGHVASAAAIAWRMTLTLWAALLALYVIGWLMAPHHVLA